MSDPNDSTITGDGISLSSTFLEFCGNLRKDDPSLLPEPGHILRIRDSLGEKELIELADALLENTNVTYLELVTSKYKKRSSAEAMAKYVRTSKHLQRICWDATFGRHQEPWILCCFLAAIQESTSLKELDIMNFPLISGPSSLALEHMLTHAQSLRALTITYPAIAMAAVQYGLKKNTTLQELTLEFPCDVTTISPILTSLRDHPLLRRLCLRGHVANLTGLDTLLLSDTSQITELEIQRNSESESTKGLMYALQALARFPSLTKLIFRKVRLGRDEVRALITVLWNNPSLETLVLTSGTIGDMGSELFPVLERITSIKVLDLSDNYLIQMKCAASFRSIIRNNKSITTLHLAGNRLEPWAGTVRCIADGLSSNSTLLKIDLSRCDLGDRGIYTLVRNMGSRNTTLQKLTLTNNSVTSRGVGVFLSRMEQSSGSITDLELQNNPIENKGASLLARSLVHNSLPSLTRLSLSECGIGDDGFIALISALEKNTSLLHLDLRDNHGGVSERAFLALAESLPEIKVLQQVDFGWCTGIVSAMPLILAGLRKNTSLFRFHVANCIPRFVPPRTEEAARCSGGWIQEMVRLGYRNRFLPLIGAPKERRPPRGIWSHALARVAILPDVIFQVLLSKPSLVPSESTEGNMEAAKDTGVPTKRKRGDE